MFITGTGATIILAGSGTLNPAQAGIFTAGEGPAYELWEKPWPEGTVGNGLEHLVDAAVLAANPHNSQPWLFRLEENRIELHADRTRKLEAIDPDERELMLGLGCGLENLLLAAEVRGYQANVMLFPNGSGDDLVASIELESAEPSPNPLYDMIPKRRTNRSRYSDKPIPDDDLVALSELAEADPGLRLQLYTEENERKPVGDLIVRACEIQAYDAAQHAETASWFRKNDKEILEHRDGITIDAGGNPSLMRILAKIFISDKMINGPSFGKEFIKSTKMQVESATVFAIISGDDKSPRTCLLGGRLYQRIHLWATSKRIAVHPMNYPLENRPELREEVAELFGANDRQALIPFRLGYGPDVPHSPRRAVEDVIFS